MDFITQLKQQYGIDLNPQQAQAVRQVQGIVLLLAVPGSGKTTVLIARLANMLQNDSIAPDQILTLTFSRRAAADMKARYLHYFPDAASPVFSTIHAFCYGVVRRISAQYNRPQPQLTEDTIGIVRNLYYAQENTRFIEREKLEEITNLISYCKNRLIDEQAAENSIKMEDCDFPRLYKAYCCYMIQHHLMDFDDMLLFTYRMFSKHPSFLAQYQQQYRYICVDEAQDSSLVQYKIIELLAQKSGNLFLVGDEDQSIYAFRGAFPDALLNFQRTYPTATILKMEQNYRSTSEIVQAASRLIQQNTAHIKKEMVSVRGTGAKVDLHLVSALQNQYEQILGLLQKPLQTAVLYRNNESAIPLVDLLTRRAIPFSIKDMSGSFFQSVQVKTFLAFLRLALDPSDLDSFSLVYHKTNAYLSRAILEDTLNQHRAGENVFRTLMRNPAVDVVRVNALRLELERMRTMQPERALQKLPDLMSFRYFESASATRRLQLLCMVAQPLNTIQQLLARLEELQLFLQQKPPIASDGRLILSTIHSSKGLEFDRVILIDLAEGLLPSNQALELLEENDRSAYEEEIRLCYVAATRAREQLHLFAPKDHTTSRFVGFLMNQTPDNKQQTAAPKEIAGYQAITQAQQLSPGMVVLHNHLGEGRILRIENGFLTWFNGVETKRLAIQICLENGNLYYK